MKRKKVKIINSTLIIILIHFNSFYFILFHFISFYFISFHFISFYLSLFQFISVYSTAFDGRYLFINVVDVLMVSLLHGKTRGCTPDHPSSHCRGILIEIIKIIIKCYIIYEFNKYL